MLWSITGANIQHPYLRLIIHMGKQISNMLWYCDSKTKTKTNKKRHMRKHAVILTEITIISLGIMENIHMNHNHPSESLHESRPWQAPCVKSLHLYLRYTFKKNMLRHLIEKYGNQMIRSHFLLESAPHLLIMGNIHPNHMGLYWCIYPNPVSEKNSIVFQKLQAALLVVRPHADKIPAKVMIDTRRAVEVKQLQIIYRGPHDLYFVKKWDSITYGIDIG